MVIIRGENIVSITAEAPPNIPVSVNIQRYFPSYFFLSIMNKLNYCFRPRDQTKALD